MNKADQIVEIDSSDSGNLFSEIEKRMPQNQKIIIGIDGAPGSGKTNLSYRIGARLQGNVINLDDYLSQNTGRYFRALNFGLLRQKINVRPDILVIEGCCLRQAMDFLEVKIDVSIYCKEISQGTRLWYFGTYFDQDLPAAKVGISPIESEVIEYHDQYQPWKEADIIYNLINQQKR